MKMTTTLHLAFALFFAICQSVCAGDINTMLMHSTFKIEGPSQQPGKTTYGTVFFVAEPIPDQPGKGRPVMITASHVLERIMGDTAKLHLRKKIGKSNYQRVVVNLTIREKGKPLWFKHPKSDVAVMYVNLLQFVEQSESLAGANLLGDDAVFEELEIHAGDKLFCLGYPYGMEANSMGFPILRSGTISSFPIVPAKNMKSFLYDFEVFGGNSGGPVYLCETARPYGGEAHLGQTRWFIAGLVSEERSAIETKVTPMEMEKRKRRYQVEETEEPLHFAVVIHAHFIKEALTLLKNQDKKTNK